MTDTYCWACEAGMYASAIGARWCTSCEPGKYQSAVAQTSCLNVRNCLAPSQYQTSPPSSTSDRVCGACATNWATLGNNEASCAYCVAGKYKDASSGVCVSCACTGQTYTNCPIGSTARSCPACYGGDLSAATCAVGQQPSAVCTGAAIQDTTCVACPAGKQKPSSGAKWCELCPTGKYKAAAGTGDCTACTNKVGATSFYANWSSTATRTTNTCPWSCVAGYYKPASGACVACNATAGKYGPTGGLSGSCLSCTNAPVQGRYLLPSWFDGLTNDCPW